MSGWIGVDLDGTLAEYDGYKGPTHIGPPVPAMLRRVKRWLAAGEDVRIFTARAYYRTGPVGEYYAALGAIRAWCRQHLGRELPITCVKDRHMRELWDDRCVQVIQNTGRRVGNRRTP